MSFDDPASYGEAWAPIYDETFVECPPELLDLLADLAGDGRVLELAIGTGRIALPLAARGVQVEGVDASPSMVERLRAKPGGDEIPVVIGDMADPPVSGPFRLIFVAFNTLFALQSQDRQIDCFISAARILQPGGSFVVECLVPDVARFDRGQRVDARVVTEDSISLDVSRHDPVQQRVISQVVTLNGQGGHGLYPVAIRYAWPSELDLMARLAGLERVERYGDWDQRPFASESGKHVTIYRKP
jgi:SAM-dependent methyltransferase